MTNAELPLCTDCDEEYELGGEERQNARLENEAHDLGVGLRTHLSGENAP